MQTIFALAKLELKQQIRSIIFWLVILFSAFLAFDGYYTSPNLWENMQWATSTVYLTVLLLALLATMAAGRSIRQRVNEIVDSTSSRSWEMVFGQWLGFAAIAALISLFTVVVLTFRALQLGGSFDLNTVLLFWLTLYFPNMLLGITVGLALGTFVPSLFISLPVTVGWWFLIGTLSDSGALPKLLPGIWAEVLDFTATTPVVGSGSLGFFPFHRYLMNRLAQVGFILALLAVMVLLFKRWRESNIHWQPIAITLLAVITLGGSMTGFALEIQEVRQSYLARWVPNGLDGAAVQAERDAWQAKGADNPAVTALSYDLDVTFEPAKHALAATAVLQVRNDGSQPLHELVFTLDDRMQVEGVYWNGDSVELVTSQGFSWRSLQLVEPLNPGATGTLKLSYSGEVWEWTTRWNEKDPELVAFISEQGIFLPPHLCWYPVPGLQNVVPMLGQYENMPEYAADFRVTVSDSNQTTVTNLQPLANGTWTGRLPGLMVAAGDWITLDTDNITLLHVKDHQLDEYVEALQASYELATAYLGPLPTERITALTVPSWFYADVDSRATQAILVGDRRLSFDKRIGQALWQRQSILSNVLSCWYDTLHFYAPSQDPEEKLAAHTRVALSSYLWSQYRETLPGQQGSLEAEYAARKTARDADGMTEPSLETGQVYSMYSFESNQLWLELEEVRRARGEDALKQTLLQWLMISRQDISREVIIQSDNKLLKAGHWPAFVMFVVTPTLVCRQSRESWSP